MKNKNRYHRLVTHEGSVSSLIVRNEAILAGYPSVPRGLIKPL